MSTQSIERQISELKQLLSFSSQFKMEMQSKISSYDSRVRSLYESGIPIEFKNTFEISCHQPTSKALKSIIDAIDSRDIPFLKQQIQSLEVALQMARRSKF
jgi:hypothetical protein